jgi:hypothetical protein
VDRNEQAKRNLDLAGGFLADLLENPSKLEEIPDGASIVLIPADDQELADANLQMVKELIHRKRSRGRARAPRGKSAAPGGVLLKSTSA